MVPLLKRLEKAGLAERRPLDRKSFAVTLTAEGLARRAEVQAIITKFETELLERIPARHREHFMPIMDALLK